MAQLWYDVVPHGNAITPSRTDSFPTKQAAYDAAVEYARKLRFVGYAVQVRVEPKPKPSPNTDTHAKAS
jgi:hypothetical protein